MNYLNKLFIIIVVTSISFGCSKSAWKSFKGQAFSKIEKRQMTKKNCDQCLDSDGFIKNIRCQKKCLIINQNNKNLSRVNKLSLLQINANILKGFPVLPPIVGPCGRPPTLCKSTFPMEGLIIPDITYGLAVFDKAGDVLLESRYIKPVNDELNFTLELKQNINEKRLQKKLESSTISFETYDLKRNGISYFTIPNKGYIK